MSTNATIIRKVNENEYQGIYLHWDGYPSHVMDCLPAYDTPEKVADLFQFGDMSELASGLDDCVFYSRDRDEDFADVCPQTFSTLKEVKDFYSNSYNYLWAEEHDTTDPKQRGWRVV